MSGLEPSAILESLEGLSPTVSHPLQRAWLALDVPQCGYCQAGQLMSAAALLARTPRPTDQQIDTAMSGNICRCGTYPRIRAAIHQAATGQPAAPAGRGTETASEVFAATGDSRDLRGPKETV